MQEPRKIVKAIENINWLPKGQEERFTGYDVMGVFRSGHYFARRRQRRPVHGLCLKTKRSRRLGGEVH